MATPLALQLLNTLLASEYVLLVATRAAHWNIEDASFVPFHELFDKQYNQISDLADSIAERNRQLGGVAFGSMREFIDHAFLTETSSHIGDARDFVTNLISLHETFISKATKTMEFFEETEDDDVTANQLQDWIGQHQKMLWFLKSHKFSN